MDRYTEEKILEARRLRDLAIDLRHQPLEVITEEQYEREHVAEVINELDIQV